MFQDYQPTEATDTAETSISHLETPGQEQTDDKSVSTAISSTNELAAEAEEQTTQEPAKPQEVEHKSVNNKAAGKSASTKSTKPKKK